MGKKIVDRQTLLNVTGLYAALKQITPQYAKPPVHWQTATPVHFLPSMQTLPQFGTQEPHFLFGLVAELLKNSAYTRKISTSCLNWASSDLSVVFRPLLFIWSPSSMATNYHVEIKKHSIRSLFPMGTRIVIYRNSLRHCPATGSSAAYIR